MSTDAYRIGLLNGDGIGPEIVTAAVACVDAAVRAVGLAEIAWVELPLGRTAIDTHGAAVPAETLTALDGLVAVPRRKRYLPMLAGMLLDVLVVCGLTLGAAGLRGSDEDEGARGRTMATGNISSPVSRSR